jgi:hypothetical protein
MDMHKESTKSPFQIIFSPIKVDNSANYISLNVQVINYILLIVNNK